MGASVGGWDGNSSAWSYPGGLGMGPYATRWLGTELGFCVDSVGTWDCVCGTYDWLYTGCPAPGAGWTIG